MTTVFVGNISYDVTKDDIVRLFSSVGTVIGFRFVTDKETGKSRGFGFCEFKNEEEAEKAIETLNNVTLRGRTIKVDSADGNQDGTGTGPKGGRQQKDIEKALGEVGLIELYDVLFKFKELIVKDVRAARKILTNYPVLAQAILRIVAIFKDLYARTNSGNIPQKLDLSTLTEDLLQNVISLTPTQIEAMPANEREKVLEILQSRLQQG